MQSTDPTAPGLVSIRLARAGQQLSSRSAAARFKGLAAQFKARLVIHVRARFRQRFRHDTRHHTESVAIVSVGRGGCGG